MSDQPQPSVPDIKAEASQTLAIAEDGLTKCDDQARPYFLALRDASRNVLMLADALDRRARAVIYMDDKGAAGAVNITPPPAVTPPRRRTIERDEAGQMVGIIEEDA